MLQMKLAIWKWDSVDMNEEEKMMSAQQRDFQYKVVELWALALFWQRLIVLVAPHFGCRARGIFTLHSFC